MLPPFAYPCLPIDGDNAVEASNALITDSDT